MAKINIQFHILPKEILAFINECANKFNLYIVAIRFFPDFEAKKINVSKFEEDIEKFNLINRICLLNCEPDLSVDNAHIFIKKNPSSLLFTIGNLTDESLFETILAANTDEPEYLKIWRKIVKQLFKITSEGAWVINPYTETKIFSKKHRYTEGAKNIEAQGLKMMPIAGWNYFMLEESH